MILRVVIGFLKDLKSLWDARAGNHCSGFKLPGDFLPPAVWGWVPPPDGAVWGAYTCRGSSDHTAFTLCHLIRINYHLVNGLSCPFYLVNSTVSCLINNPKLQKSWELRNGFSTTVSMKHAVNSFLNYWKSWDFWLNWLSKLKWVLYLQSMALLSSWADITPLSLAPNNSEAGGGIINSDNTNPTTRYKWQKKYLLTPYSFLNKPKNENRKETKNQILMIPK